MTRFLPDSSELRRQTQENLITFLRVEGDLGSTFVLIAETTDDPRHRAKLVQDIQAAMDTIRHFEARITDQSVRAELRAEADKLQVFLSKRKG